MQQGEELPRVGLRQIDEMPQERTEHESPLAGLRMHADDGMFGLINGGSENVEVAFQLGVPRSRAIPVGAVGIDTFVLSGYPGLEEAYYVAELLFPKLPIRREAWPAEALAAG